MTRKQYLIDDSLKGQVKISEVIANERPVIRLETTWFHPQGGGQKCDRGTIGGVDVYSVRHGDDGAVDHFVASLDGLEVGQTYPFIIDADWRRLNARYHTAGHLLACVCEAELPGLKAINGHQWPGEARVEFEGDVVSTVGEKFPEIQSAVDFAVNSALPIQIVGDPFSSRAVQIGDYAPIPCGGTHLRSSSDLGRVVVRSAKVKNGLVRVGYELMD